MAGFPHMQLDRFLPALVRAGFRVATCEPVPDKVPHGKRAVVRVGPQSQRRTGCAELRDSTDPADAHDLHARAVPDSHAGHGGSGDRCITVAFFSPRETAGKFWPMEAVEHSGCSLHYEIVLWARLNGESTCGLPPATCKMQRYRTLFAWQYIAAGGISSSMVGIQATSEVAATPGDAMPDAARHSSRTAEPSIPVAAGVSICAEIASRLETGLFVRKAISGADPVAQAPVHLRNTEENGRRPAFDRIVGGTCRP